MRQNWLTQRPRYRALPGVMGLVFLLLALTWIDWSSWKNLNQLLTATPYQVFEQHQYYRLWTSLFVHADGSHLLSNLVFLIPFAYLLSAYFGSVLWPIATLVAGGLINWTVLHTLPADMALVGISGIDNWLGAVWLTLFYLIDRRESRRRRFAVVLFITFVLFVPDTYKPEVSYLSHLVGYILGVFSAFLFYAWKKSEFKKAEVFEEIQDGDTISSTFQSHQDLSQEEMSNF